MSEISKMPKGATPHYIVHEERITELCNAISRRMEFMNSRGCSLDMIEGYYRIKEWAKEIEALAELEIKMWGES